MLKLFIQEQWTYHNLLNHILGRNMVYLSTIYHPNQNQKHFGAVFSPTTNFYIIFRYFICRKIHNSFMFLAFYKVISLGVKEIQAIRNMANGGMDQYISLT